MTDNMFTYYVLFCASILYLFLTTNCDYMNVKSDT